MSGAGERGAPGERRSLESSLGSAAMTGGPDAAAVAYDAAGQVTMESKPLDAEGRAIFDGLATDGSRSYRAVAILRRPGATPGQTIEDRVVSQDLAPPPMVGLRLMLAGEAPGSAAPAVDDHSKLDDFAAGTAPPLRGPCAPPASSRNTPLRARPRPRRSD